MCVTRDFYKRKWCGVKRFYKWSKFLMRKMVNFTDFDKRRVFCICGNTGDFYENVFLDD